MAATLDDLLYVATAQRVDIRSYLDKIEAALTKGPPAGAPAGGPAAPSAGLMTGLTTGSARIIGLFGALEKSLTSFGSQVAKFVGQASPVHVMRLNLAIADLQAVIGRALIPVIEKVTVLVRKLADAFINLSPEAQKFAAGLGVGAGIGATIAAVATAFKLLVGVFGRVPIIIGTLISAFVGVATTMDSGKAVISAFDGVMKGAITLFETLARAIMPILEAGLVPILETLGEAFKRLAETLRMTVNSVRSLFGLKRLEDGGRSSTGAAVRNVEIGDVQSYINKAYRNAYMGAGEEGKDQQKRAADYLEKIHNILQKSNPLAPDPGSLGSVQPGFNRLGAPGLGRGIDTLVAPILAPARFAVEGMRALFG